MKLAILYEGAAYSMAGKVMGRQAAGHGLMQAIADARPERLWCYTHPRAAAAECARTLAQLGAPGTELVWIPADQPERLAQPGLLYRPDPVIGSHAWHRLARSSPRAYSLCGITFTISSRGAMSGIAELLTAPVEPWDAVICISSAGREAVRQVLEAQAEHLRERLGAARFTLPQLPVIPLGVHVRELETTPERRAAARARLGLAEDEVAVLFAGRLMVHAKAHPLPMYLALEQAAQLPAAGGRRVVLIQAGKAPNEAVARIYEEEPRRFCPSVRVVTVDGGDFALYRAAWAAADLFTSLSDNVQETYGLTPVEAMAAGLPAVVSDWDGYRDTVRDGVDGFRVPTLSLPPGCGGGLADRYDMEVDDYDLYSFHTSQLVAVDVAAAAQAYARLIGDPALRRRMGEAGARRAREAFDWPAVLRRYEALWEELAERRRSDPQLAPPPTRRRRPDRADPFSMFANYPTHQAGPGLRFRVRAGLDAAAAAARRDLLSTRAAQAVQPGPDLIAALLAAVGGSWRSFEAVAAALPASPQHAVGAGLVWLCKVGVLDFERS